MDINPLGHLVDDLAAIIDAGADLGTSTNPEAAAPPKIQQSVDDDPLGNMIRRLAALIESDTAEA